MHPHCRPTAPPILAAVPTTVVTRRELNLRAVPAAATLHVETTRFYAFKHGDLAAVPVYADRLAASLGPAAHAGRLGAVVPVPLSPDRAAAGAAHRTRALAFALAERLGIPALELLALADPVTKHAHLRRRPTPADVRAWSARYRRSLRFVPAGALPSSALLLDDAVARGNTLAACAGFLRSACANVATVHAATAVRFDSTAADPSARAPPLPPRPTCPPPATALKATRPTAGRRTRSGDLDRSARGAPVERTGTVSSSRTGTFRHQVHRRTP